MEYDEHDHEDRTECYCNVGNAPCSYCTDPDNWCESCDCFKNDCDCDCDDCDYESEIIVNDVPQPIPEETEKIIFSGDPQIIKDRKEAHNAKVRIVKARRSLRTDIGL